MEEKTEEKKAVASFKIKSGKFAILASVILLLLFVASIGMTLLIFDYDTSSPTFWTNVQNSCLWLLVGIVSCVIANMLFQFIFLKIYRVRKIGIHVGLLVEVCGKTGMKRNDFFGYHFLSNFIPFVVATFLTAFFWSDYMFILLISILGNMLAYIPVYVFVFKQKKNSSFIIEKGFLNVYAEAAEEEKAEPVIDSAQ